MKTDLPTPPAPAAETPTPERLDGRLFSAGNLTIDEEGEKALFTGVAVACSEDALRNLKHNLVYSEVSIYAKDALERDLAARDAELADLRAALCCIKDRVAHGKYFSADEIVEYISTRVGKYSQGVDWIREKMIQEVQADLASRDAELAALRERETYFREEITFLATGASDLAERFKGDKQLVLVADLRAQLQTATERAERAERERDGLKTSGMDADTCIEIEELKKFKARLEWLGNPANKFAYSIEKDGEVKVGTRWDFQRFKTLSAAIDHFRGINSAHAASADGHARKEEAP